MALFGSADRKLPFVTQAYQVDTANLEEVRELAVRLSEEPRKVFFLFILPKPPTAEELNNLRLEEFRPLADLCTLIQSLMRSLQETGEYQASLLLYLMRFSREFPLPPMSLELNFPDMPQEWNNKPPSEEQTAKYILDNPAAWLKFLQKTGQPLGKDFSIPAGQVSFHYEYEAHPMHSLMASAIAAVQEAISVVKFEGVHSVLRKCVECKNVFLIQKNHPDQMYCSHRCANRVAMRRRRQKEAEERKKTPV
jgi:hypothetical protein